ncbi:MAG TPA: bifunctional oligoribonuclease/PAP phosphatase NrnA [Actinomycetota bacterium]
MTITEAVWNDAVAAIDAAAHPVLACHLGPDGDALGSMVALALGLATRGRKVTASWSEPYGVPRQYEFLPGLDLLSPPSDVPAEPEVMITFDAGSLERLGTLEPNARAAGKLIVVDHHRSNDHFGHINLIDPDAAASAVLVHELLGRMGIPLDQQIAQNLYAGLVTDTGRFQYSNTTPRVMQIAADLISHDIDHPKIARIVYDTHPIGYLRLLSIALSRIEMIPGPSTETSMVWTWIDNDDVKTAGIGMDDTEALIDVVRVAEEAEVACVLKETPDGRFKVSMRAKGAADVGAICEALGGGGHALAAGFTADGSDPRAIALDIAARLKA